MYFVPLLYCLGTFLSGGVGSLYLVANFLKYMGQGCEEEELRFVLFRVPWSEQRSIIPFPVVSAIPATNYQICKCA